MQFVAHPASAESLREALVTAYTANPELDAERARQRATDEGVPQALSGARPTVTASGEIGSKRTWSRTVSSMPPPAVTRTTGNSDPAGVSLSFSQPLFRGFRTFTGTASAEASVMAGRYALGNVEQNVLLSAVTAYVDVVRDQALVRLTQNNLDFLREEFESTEARFEVGELTKTDVAQAESRVSGAVSEVSQARANLSRSRATYEQVIGRPPGTLSAPTSLNGRLPRSLTDAYKIGEAEHPALLSSRHTIEASDHDVDNITGELLPTLTLDGDYTRSWNSSSTTLDTETSSIMGRLVVPLYQAGSVSSRVRQARQVATQRRLESENIRSQIRAAIATAWDGLIAARAQINADRQRISAAKIALDGVIQEQRVGQRTTLDVLDAQRELLTAQVGLATSTRDEVVAAFTLLASVGHLNARQLELPVAYYDDTAHYDKVRNKWWGLSVESPH
ncbi:MAG: TolC family outer membrane protein [Rhizobiales bacterium]|nr:TolC family outer membrane protein [Hyphomicrobiales bacterium]